MIDDHPEVTYSSILVIKHCHHHGGIQIGVPAKKGWLATLNRGASRISTKKIFSVHSV